MEWADICWFEWCDELIGYGSKLELAKRKKIICRIHGYEVYTDSIRNVEWKNVNELIIVTPHIRRIFEENTEDINKGNLKIDTVFCGVNLDAYPLNIKEKGFNIGYLGYINFKKNLPLTMDIFKKLHDIDSRYKLYLAGEIQDARTFRYIKYFVNEHGLLENVQFDGWQDSKSKVKWFKKINYMIISSIDEGLCYAAAEAMCSGIKPILHNCEGIKDHYDKKYIFNTIEEAVNMIISNEYNSIEYRKFIKNRYSLQKQLKAIKGLINDIEKNELESMK
ncbi:glycosyltransferase [Clostridium sp. OS1-26]|uniref:glycosyltransferase n=1 Tax=Clostridium sp. OS1-26 TaxID=3070681 RepID=UPI0027E11B3B|nr:glycosyltransferase [Clostridium sp. OS1-26]WML35493.1 glycosyltransferase [Clostridium sp. OS1-26]